VNPELEVLLAVQRDDERIRELSRELEALAPRERELNRQLEVESGAAARAEAEVAGELERRKALASRIAEHRRMHERNVAQLDQVKRLRDATVAQAQVDMARRILADEEAELENLDRRIEGIRERIAGHEERHSALLESQKPDREQLQAERSAIEERARAIRAKRDAKAARISPTMLRKYERIANRAKGQAVYPLLEHSCGACNTAIPLQRQNAMLSGAIDVCETCGMLLYASHQPAVENAEQTSGA
jgi:predicted  nucleic acid-binding Zn-ribbon protein